MNETLIELGLGAFFTRQLSVEELETGRPARVIAVHRSSIVVIDGATESSVTLTSAWFERAPEERPTVGDRVLLDQSGTVLLRLLERRSLFKRMAAGDKVGLQLLAANIDTLFVVTSCNEEFNESRLERYLALALDAGADPGGHHRRSAPQAKTVWQDDQETPGSQEANTRTMKEQLRSYR